MAVIIIKLILKYLFVIDLIREVVVKWDTISNNCKNKLKITAAITKYTSFSGDILKYHRSGARMNRIMESMIKVFGRVLRYLAR